MRMWMYEGRKNKGILVFTYEAKDNNPFICLDVSDLYARTCKQGYEICVGVLAFSNSAFSSNFFCFKLRIRAGNFA